MGKGLQVILDAIKDMEPKHMEHMALYGTGNEFRMTGLHETAKFDEYSWGIANRGCSIRVTRSTEENGGGHFEDRRPSANCDPYNVCAICAAISYEKTLKHALGGELALIIAE